MPNYNIYSDTELIRLFDSDDERILVEIYERYWDKLLAVAFNRLGNLQEAEECVQDVLYKLWKLRFSLSLEKDKLSHYLARAIKNQTLNVIAHRSRRQGKLEAYVSDQIDEITPERKLLIQELQQQMDKAIKNLPPQCQLVFVLNKEEGLSTKEIAEKLQLSENTVKSHLKKAKKDLGNSTDILITLVFVYIYYQRF